MHIIDKLLNSITMYRLVLYGLILVSLVGILLGTTSLIFYSGSSLLFSLSTLLFSCYVTNIVFAKLFKVPTNTESSLITALILFLIMFPAESVQELLNLSIVGVLAISSKYILAINKKLIFNPAAFGAFIAYLLNISGASWWVANPYMLPVVLVVGVLFVRKIRRFAMSFVFFVSAFISIFYFNYSRDLAFSTLFLEVFKSWPLIFFGTVMFTEPITTPPTKRLQLIYGVLVGLLFGSQFLFWKLSPTPEFVLLVGNIFSYFVNLKRKILLTLIEKKEIGEGILEFIFSPDQKFDFKPGQYVELTLGHTSDNRGNRRYFTIASSPTEPQIKFGIKMNKPSSSFKEALQKLEIGSKVFAGQLAGDFVLPIDANKKLVFIAGGIGVTPFRSMIQYLIDTKSKRHINLLYFAREETHFVYKDIFADAQDKIGLTTHYLVSKDLTELTLKKELGNLENTIFYISGPDALVNKAKQLLKELGVASTQITTDYFPGFA